MSRYFSDFSMHRSASISKEVPDNLNADMKAVALKKAELTHNEHLDKMLQDHRSLNGMLFYFKEAKAKGADSDSLGAMAHALIYGAIELNVGGAMQDALAACRKPSGKIALS